MRLTPLRHLTAASLPSHGRKTSSRRGRLPTPSSGTTGGTVHVSRRFRRRIAARISSSRSQTDSRSICAKALRGSARFMFRDLPESDTSRCRSCHSANASPYRAYNRLLSIFINNHCQISAPCRAHKKSPLAVKWALKNLLCLAD